MGQLLELLASVGFHVDSSSVRSSLGLFNLHAFIWHSSFKGLSLLGCQSKVAWHTLHILHVKTSDQILPRLFMYLQKTCVLLQVFFMKQMCVLGVQRKDEPAIGALVWDFQHPYSNSCFLVDVLCHAGQATYSACLYPMSSMGITVYCWMEL